MKKVFFLLFLLSTSVSLSQTDVEGNISEDTTWEKAKGPYNVTANISIAKDITLKIEPGVKINFAQYAKMTVNGELLAEGTAQDSIIFNGNQWSGIQITTLGSKIKYARISNASASWCPNGNCYGSVQLYKTELSNSNIYNIYGGISANHQSILKFNEIHDMTNNGLSLGGGSEAYGNIFYRSNLSYSNNSFINISGSNQVWNPETEKSEYGEYVSVFKGNKIYNIPFAISANQYSLIEKNHISYTPTPSKNSIGIFSCGVGYSGNSSDTKSYPIIKNNIISGFWYNVVLGSEKVQFTGNTFDGAIDFEDGQRNVFLTIQQVNNRSCMMGGSEGDEISVNIQSNYWKNVSDDNIAKSIEDYVDNIENKLKADYSNYLTLPDDNTPVSPPVEFTRTLSISGNDLIFSWKENIESDISGYKLYYEKNNLLSKNYNKVIDISKTKNSYTLTGGKRGVEYALSAYDMDADGTNDQFDGNESFFSVIEGEYLIQKDDPFDGLSKSSVSWGDYDQDGDMDLALMGQSNSSGSFTDIYKNDEGKFTRMFQNFKNVYDGDLSWVDLNKDGYLDLVVSGYNETPQLNIYISENKAQYFSSSSNDFGLPKLFSTKMAWGDLDNDGDIDLTISGIDSDNNKVFNVYYRENGQDNFIKEENFNSSLDVSGYLEIIDIDLDGDNDIKYSGGIVLNSFFRTTYNQNNNWQSIPTKNSSIGFIKFKNRPTLDYIEMGENSSGELVINNSASGNYYMPGENTSFPSITDLKLKNGDITIGDYNNDGYDDVVITGENENGEPITKLYDGGISSFIESTIQLVGLRESTADWVDYDMDGDLDLFLSGLDTNGAKTLLYETEVEMAYNESPSEVTGLKAEDLGNGKIKFSWDIPTDDISTNIGYVIRLGTSPGGTELSNTLSNLSTGNRLISQPPPIYSNSYETILDPGKYYYAIQAVDGGLKASNFSEESSYTLKYEWKLLNQGGIVDRKIQGLDKPVMKLGDIDNDNDLDLIYGSSSGSNTNVLKFDGSRMIGTLNYDIGGGWNNTNNPINQTRQITDIDVGDINGDGLSDIVINSFTANQDENNYIKIFVGNEEGGTNETRIDLGLYKGKVKIIDMNNDGQSEVVLIGLTADNTSGVPKVYVYELNPSSESGGEGPGNSFLTFTKIDLSSQLDGLRSASYDLGDVDNDQDIDIIISGFDESQGLKCYIYENIGKIGMSYELKKTNNNLAAIRDGTVDFIDFDSDGDLDAAISGTGLQGDIFEIYMNDLKNGNSNWPRMALGLSGIRNGKVDLGDFNGDGYTDIVYSGLQEGSGKVTKLSEYISSTKKYQDSSFDVSDIIEASVEFGDIDGDGDLDFIMSGEDKDGLASNYDPWSNSKYIFRAYLNKRNESAAVEDEESEGGVRKTASSTENLFTENTPPSVPEVIETKILLSEETKEGNLVIEFSWNASTDDLTPSDGLTYALKIGTTENGEEIMSTNSNSNGLRKTAEKGNAEHNLRWKISLPYGEYYWSVQSIDASFNGSKFSESNKFLSSSSLKLGDSNGDQSVNILDLTNVIDKILGNKVNLWVQQTSDINNDGKIDVVDVTALVGIIMNSSSSGISNGSDINRNLNYFSNKPVGSLKMIYIDNKLFIESDKKVTGLQFSVNQSIHHLFNDEIIDNFNIVSYNKNEKITYLIYSNDNKSIIEFSNKIFDYVDNNLKKYEISNIRAATINGLTLNTSYIDENFFDTNNNVIKIYPNPVYDNINILGSIEYDLKITDVSIYNLVGTRVYNNSFQSIKRFKMIDLSILSSGMYFIKIKTLLNNSIKKEEVYKFIKN